MSKRFKGWTKDAVINSDLRLVGSLPHYPEVTGKLEVKRSKYGNKKVVIDNITFDSKKEGKHYNELLMRKKAGEISDLKLQFPFELKVDGTVIGKYLADFYYYDELRKQMVVIDTKGYRTQLYKWKKKHFEAQYRFKIEEV